MIRARTRRPQLVAPFAVVLVAASWIVLSPGMPVTHAQATSNHDATREDFDQLMKQLSNWGRWGKNDQLGAVNLITPAKRKQALGSVKEGFSVSMARTAEMEPAIDNPRPILHDMANRRAANPPSDIGGASDSFLISYHGLVHTHMDAFCHRTYKGQMYNGMPTSEITDKACNEGSIFSFKDGIITHGVLMDIPRLKGVDYLEPGTRIYPEDLDAWAKQAHLKIEPGDAVL